MLYMFWTILVHHQEQPFISHTLHLVYSGTSGCCVVIGRTGPQKFVHLVGLYTYRLSYFLTAQKACLYAVSKTLSLKWKQQCIESCFPLFIARMNT